MLSLKSRLVAKLLGFLFLHENESFYVNELSRGLALDRGNLIRKLREFEGVGLLQSEFKGAQKYYCLNKQFPLYKEYRGIVQKTIGLESKLKVVLQDVPGIQNAWLFGSYATGKMDDLSDIDLLVVGCHQTVALHERLAPLQKFFGREINAVSMSGEEFVRRREAKDPLVTDIFKGRNIQLL